MSLEPLSFPAPGITGSKRSLQQTRSETSSRSHKTRDIEARVSENRSQVSNTSKDSRKLDSHTSDESASTRHTSTVRTMFSSEKPPELTFVKQRHEELEGSINFLQDLKSNRTVLSSNKVSWNNSNRLKVIESN